MMSDNLEAKITNIDDITEKDIIKIFQIYKRTHKDAILKSHSLRKASDHMIGFLSDYWKLELQITAGSQKIEAIHFFIKSIARSNEAKAKMVKEMNLYEKELTFYLIIKEKINLPDLPPWSGNLVTTLNEAMVFEDLNFLRYEMRNKFETFDEQHTLLALKTLARFHAGALVYEEKKRKQLNKCYIINDEHKNDLDRGCYEKTDPWFRQCMKGGIEAVKYCSKYTNNGQMLEVIESRWTEVWIDALDLSHFSFEYRNVICHRDLWNNNILFRYKEGNKSLAPDNCVLVDFQAITCQPPAGDVMLLLHCNLERKFREKNMSSFLNYYFRELEAVLGDNGIKIADIIPFKEFLKSCEKYKLWGLVASACLVQLFWIDDDLTTKIFCDTDNFQEILTKDKASFIKRMIETNDDYKNKVIQVFEEIVDVYCLDNKQ